MSHPAVSAAGVCGADAPRCAQQSARSPSYSGATARVAVAALVDQLMAAVTGSRATMTGPAGECEAVVRREAADHGTQEDAGPVRGGTVWETHASPSAVTCPHCRCCEHPHAPPRPPSQGPEHSARTLT